jgi:basic amino acid/polyamine antiporter, APA family
MQGLFIRKSVDQIRAEVGAQGLKRTLGPFNLVSLGVGCIIGAGIYVMAGNAAANYAGPAVMLSFVLAGLACGFTGLCYAELSSTIPASGSSYTYAYAALGEGFAWLVGWLLMLEYGLAGSALAVGFSSYLVNFLASLGLSIPEVLSTPLVQSHQTLAGIAFSLGHSVNLVAAFGLFAVIAILTVGVSESATVNNVIVVTKLLVLLLFVAIAFPAVKPHNWTPFIPPSRGGFTYGPAGVFRAASVLFFAYLGFETVSTAAAEAKNPQRDLPIGILGALALCTSLYILVAAVLTGVVPYGELGVADPIALAIDRIGRPGFSLVIKIGALMGLSSVLLVNTYGQSRICFAMSRDGLLPKALGAIHPRFHTPYIGTILLGVISAVAAAILPIAILGDLVSLGTGLAFSVVALSVIWLRTTRPELERPFRVPLGGVWIKGVWVGVVPALAILLCLGMVTPVILDIVGKAMSGDAIPAVILGVYALCGVGLYAGYGYRNSRLRHGQQVQELVVDPLSPPTA